MPDAVRLAVTVGPPVGGLVIDAVPEKWPVLCGSGSKKTSTPLQLLDPRPVALPQTKDPSGAKKLSNKVVALAGGRLVRAAAGVASAAHATTPSMERIIAFDMTDK